MQTKIYLNNKSLKMVVSKIKKSIKLNLLRLQEPILLAGMSVTLLQVRDFVWTRSFKGCSFSKFVSPSSMTLFAKSHSTAIFGFIALILSISKPAEII